MEKMREDVQERDKRRAEIYLATVLPARAHEKYAIKKVSVVRSKWKERDDQRQSPAEGCRAEEGVPVFHESTQSVSIEEESTAVAAADKGSSTSDVARIRLIRRTAHRQAKQARVKRAQERLRAQRNDTDIEEVRDDEGRRYNVEAFPSSRITYQSAEDLEEPNSTAKVSLVQRRTEIIRNKTSAEAPAVHNIVEADDGLPTAMMVVAGVQRCIKLDSCARYTVAGTNWMKYGDKIRDRPPVDYVEGIGGFRLNVIGVWRFKLRSVLNEEVIVDACVIDGCTDEFLLGVDFMQQNAAVMDFERSELRYRGAIRAVTIPFRTFDEKGSARTAAVRLARKTHVEDGVVRPIAIAVSAQDGEQGIFLPTSHVGAVMLAATVTTVQGGRAWVPAINSNSKAAKLPHRRDLGTWIPLSEDIEVLKMSGALDAKNVMKWLEEMGGTDTPLENENEITIGAEDAESRRLITKLLRAYRELTRSSGDCPPATVLDLHHHIDTGDAAPIMLKRRRQAQVEDQIINEHVTKMLEAGVIEEGNGAWGFPVVLVKKKDGEVRFCVDYRALNKVTKKDVYPLPRIDETLESLGGAMLFSTLDLRAGYWQILVSPDDKDKTAFTTKRGLFRFVRMPFGLTNAPSTFQRMMNHVLRGLNWLTCLVYLDDIVVFTRGGIEQHVLELACVFERLSAAGLTLKLKKCVFAATSMEYLGHELNCEGVRPLQRLVSAVQDFPKPETTEQAKRFVHLAGYYRRFIKGFGSMMAPITKLLRKGVKWEWTTAQDDAFRRVKEVLTSKPLLLYPNFQLPFRLMTDASVVGLGACLTQDQGNGWQPVAYASKVNSETEAKYGITELECLAVVWAIKLFRPYLYGRRFEIFTDHAALKWLMTSSNLTGKLHRWALTLQEFDMDVQYRPGKANAVADALSRAPAAGRVRSARGKKRRWRRRATTEHNPPAVDAEPERATNLEVCADGGERSTIKEKSSDEEHWGVIPARSVQETVTEKQQTEEGESVLRHSAPPEGDNPAHGVTGSNVRVWTAAPKQKRIPRRTTFLLPTRSEALRATPDESREVRSSYAIAELGFRTEEKKNEPTRKSKGRAERRHEATTQLNRQEPEVRGLEASKGQNETVPRNDLEVTEAIRRGQSKAPSVATPARSRKKTENTRLNVPGRPRNGLNKNEGGSTLQLTDDEIAAAQKKSRLVQKLLSAGTHRGQTVEVKYGLVLIQTANGPRVILPPALWAVVFKENHDSVWAGHFRATHTYSRIAQLYWWPDLMREVKKWVRGCQDCGSRKARPREVIPPLRSLRGGEVCDRWALDVAGPLPVTDGGQRYVIAALEYVTRYAVAAVVPDHTAETVAKFLMKNVVLRFGPFRELLTDGAPELTGEVIEELVKLLQAHQTTPVPYRPQFIGLVERFHRTWKDCVATYMGSEDQRDWDVWVDFATYAYNSGEHSTVKLSPNELMMGRKLRSPNELLRAMRVTETGNLTEYHRKLLVAMKRSGECAEQARKQEQERQAKYYNRQVRNTREVKPGHRVWMYKPPRGAKASKFVHPWIGPLRVVEAAGYDNFVVEREDTEDDPEQFIAHVSFLVTYYSPADFLKKTAEDIEAQLEYEDAQQQEVDVTTSAKVVRGAEVPFAPAAPRAVSKRSRATVASEDRNQRSSEKLVEIRRRRKRNKAGQYVLEFEVRPTGNREEGNGAPSHKNGQRWISMKEYEELFRHDRVVEDSMGEEGV